MESVTDHIRLPPECTVEKQGCLTNDGTFIWDPILESCRLRRVQSVFLQEEGPLMVDHQHKLVFELEGVMTTPFGCPMEAKVYATKWNNLYLTTSLDFPHLSGVDVDIALYADTRFDYLQYNMEREVNGLTDTLSTQLCETSYGSKTHEIVRLRGEDNFGLRSGDVFLSFNCPEKISSIATPDGMCWDAVKLENGLFVDVVTRVARKHAKQMDCSTHFPMYVQTYTGDWVTVSDVINPVDPPNEQQIVHGYPPHETFTVAGLYTKDELSSWESLASWGSYHDAVSTKIAQGICLAESGPCARTVGQTAVAEYDLSRLLAAAGIETLWDRFNNWIQENVGILCVIVLCTYGMQWGIAIVMAVHSFVADGAETALGGLYVAFCPTPHMFARLRYQERRRRHKEKSSGEELTNLQINYPEDDMA